ncbi:hypothetical protein [Chromohalobacter sp. 48-RD10]|uniref:hypothetical protein n=1 Tax=Chromohalobacter sp. 48-RD10 TaxID=2994063 RepID=UPI00246893C2|nr:hypothetical protein [Chromohalobacter sp. 48-RD10]
MSPWSYSRQVFYAKQATDSARDPRIPRYQAAQHTLHCDDRLFHSVDGIHQEDTGAPFESFIIIINSRFVDAFQNQILRRHFPEAVLNETR